MKVYGITMVYCDLPILAHGVKNLYETCGEEPWEHLFLDNHWPLAKEGHHQGIVDIAKSVGGSVFDAGSNLGGTDGITFLAKQADALGCEPNDLIGYFDPDQNMVTKDWLSAMVQVMRADPKIGVCCAWPYQEMRDDWREESIAGIKIRTFPGPDMFSCHVWRRSFMGDKVNGHYKWYGQIEMPAFERAQKMGMYSVWLPEFKEAPCPIPHHKDYTRWKKLHVMNAFLGDFGEYLEEKKRTSS